MAESVLWSGVVSASRPLSFSSPKDGELLDLHACLLKASDSRAPSTLRCAHAGGAPMSIARASADTPACKMRAKLSAPFTLTVAGPGELRLSGLVTPAVGTPSRKRARSAGDGAAVGSSAVPATRASQSPVLAARAQVPSSPAKAARVQPQTTTPAASKALSPRTAPAVGRSPYSVAMPVKQSTAPPVDGSQPKAEEKTSSKRDRPLVAFQRRHLASGLQIEVMEHGSGMPAVPGKKVNVRYEGRLKETGKIFDSGVIAFRLGLGEVIKGWDEGIKGMLKGEHRRLSVPSRLAYGTTGAPPIIPPNSELVFDVHLESC